VADKAGGQGRIDDYLTSARIFFNLRTPANYRAEVRHPLIVVYAPGGHDRNETEDLVRLTHAATEAGFLIAFADNHPMSMSAFDNLAEVPRLITRRWCVDEARIYLTGHSNGGLVSNAIAFRDSTRDLPAAIAPSAAGIRGAELEEQACPDPISVMVMHGARDTLFPGYGKEAAAWWAACNQCEDSPSPPRDDGCVVYPGCAKGTETLYCETDIPHAVWPDLNESLLGFLVKH
jgi:polyhydroxybutyrate depolymerase